MGTGGFATVYRAVDERLEAVVALKVLADDPLLRPRRARAVPAGGSVLRRIGSPHVVAVHDMGETDRGQPYLVLDHADRGTLATRVPRAAGGRLATRSRRRCRRGRGARRSRSPPCTPSTSSIATSHRATCCCGRSGRRGPAGGCPLDRGRRAGAAGRSGAVEGPRRRLGPDGGRRNRWASRRPSERGVSAQVDRLADVWAASAVLVWLLTGDGPDDAGDWRSPVTASGWPPALVAARPGAWPHGATTVIHRGGLARRGRDDALAPPAVPAPPVVPAVPLAARTARPDGRKPPPARSRAPMPPGGPAGPAAGAGAGGRLAAVVLAAVEGAWRAGALDRGRRARPAGRRRGGRRRAGLGLVRTTVRSRVTGPATVDVGDTATYTAEVEGRRALGLVRPDGAVHADVDTIDVETASAGVATVRLRGVDGADREVTVEHRLERRVTRASPHGRETAGRRNRDPLRPRTDGHTISPGGDDAHPDPRSHPTPARAGGPRPRRPAATLGGCSDDPVAETSSSPGDTSVTTVADADASGAADERCRRRRPHQRRHRRVRARSRSHRDPARRRRDPRLPGRRVSSSTHSRSWAASGSPASRSRPSTSPSR